MSAWNHIARPIIGLSPMADMTDTPFNLICRSMGASVIFREMVSAEALVRESAKTFKMIAVDPLERPVAQQLFGSEPAVMAEAARLVEEHAHPEFIDINMGCPVYKVVSNFDGAALMRDPKQAALIVRAVKSAIRVPVSVKTRLGWSDDRDCIEFVKVLEGAGADLITVHGRTKSQAYAGTANWERVGEAKKGISIPLLVNGDITSLESARTALAQSEADGCLIGRGALGNPWIFTELKEGLSGTSVYQPPTLEERIATIRLHADYQVKRYGDHGLIKLRKHLPFYLKGIPGWKDIRMKLVRVSTNEELNDILDTLMSNYT